MSFKKALVSFVPIVLLLFVTACGGQSKPVATPIVTPEATVDVTPAATEVPVDNGGDNGNQAVDMPVGIDWSTIEWTPAEAFEYEIFVPSEHFTNDFMVSSPDFNEFLGGLNPLFFEDYYKTVPQDIKDMEAVVITGYDFSRDDTIVRIPDEIEGKPVLMLDRYAFSPQFTVLFDWKIFEHVTESIYIPDSVIIISHWAFDKNSTLSEIRLPNPNSSLYIDRDVFKGCDSLIRIDYPDNLYFDGWGMFAYYLDSLDSLEVITFPSTPKNVWAETCELIRTYSPHIEVIIRD